MSRQKRILVIRPDRIGDTVCATPLLRGLRQTWPDAFLAAMVRPSVKPVLEHNPHIDTIITDDYEGADKGRSGFWRMVAVLRQYKFTHALILLPTERHTWMTFVAGIRTRVGVGFRPYHLLTFTRMASRNKYIPLRHEADYCLDLGRAIGVEYDDLREEVIVTNDERAKAKDLLTSYGLDVDRAIVSVHPQSGGSAPNWQPEKYAKLVRELLEADPVIQVAVNVVPGNTAAMEAFAGLDPKRVVFPDNGGDLRMLIGIIAEAGVAVSASTGPMHLAAGLGTPTVSLFCPLTACSPVLWGPRGNEATVLVQEQQYCDTVCDNSPHTCRFDYIDVDTVKNAVLEILKKRVRR